MRGIIVGGGTFLGYWLKHKIISSSSERPIIIDLPRNGTRVYVSNKDRFYPLQEVNYQAIKEYNPNYILFNYYDLFDAVSLEINKSDNIIMDVTNKLLDIAQDLGSQIYVLTHINRYPKTDNSFKASFNNLNDLYLQYIELISKAKGLKTRIFLLPNLFGSREPQNGVIPTIIRKVINQEELQLTQAKRDFMYVDSVVEQISTMLFGGYINGTEILYYLLTSGEKISILKIYEIICMIVGTQTKATLVDESYSVKRADISTSKVQKIVIQQNYLYTIGKYDVLLK